MTSVTRAYIKIIVATVLFSLNPTLFKTIDLCPLTILWTVNVVGLVTLTFNRVVRGQAKDIVRRGRGTVALLALGSFFTVNNWLFIFSIKTTTVANAVLTHYLAPVFVFLFGTVLVRENITKMNVLALGLSVAGLGVILSPNELNIKDVHFFGLMLGTLSAVFFALEILLKKMLTAWWAADVIVIRYLLISVLLLGPGVSINELAAVGGRGWAILLMSGAIVSGVGIALFTAGLAHVRAQHAGVISYLEPFGAIIWAIFAIGELPGLATVAGGALILLGTYLIVRQRA